MSADQTPFVTRRAVLSGAGAALVAALAGCGSQADGDARLPATSTGAPSGATVVGRTRAGAVETLVVRSSQVPGDRAVTVLLPAGYDTSPGRHYPVLYLLHGSGGGARSWLDGGVLTDAVGSREVICVMPDGGLQGWYLDWAQQEPAVCWESFHIREVLPLVDATYRTIPSRAGRAIAGISMGGFGAVHYAEAYPSLFCAVSSYSGALSLRSPRDFVALDAAVVDDKPAFAVFGQDAVGERSAAVDPINGVGALSGMRVSLWSGDGVTPTGTDAGEIGFGTAMRMFQERASAAGVPCTATTLPGGHDWAVWGPAFRRDLPQVLDVLAAPTWRFVPRAARRRLPPRPWSPA